MSIGQKLKIIQGLKNLTQTQLADILKVSFPTLNSWINDKSSPRAKKLKLIDQLYLKCSGQKIIPEDNLSAKKQIILQKIKHSPSIIKTIKERQDLFDQFILSLTYNTNSIEGSTLTENETADILFHNATFKNRDLIEHLEAKNHQSSLEYLFESVGLNYKITEAFICELHHILMNSIRPDAGSYRVHGVRIVGANVPTANHLKISVLMNKLILDINKKPKDVIAHVTTIHSKFEQIHPFSDGNGRIGRLIMTAMLLAANLPPAVIKKEKKHFYYKFLQKAQQNQDYGPLEDFICDAIFNGIGILAPLP